MDGGGAVEGEGGGIAAVQQVDQDRREAALDDVAAEAPQDAAAAGAGVAQSGDDGAERIGGEELGETVEPVGEGQGFLRREAHVLEADLAAALSRGIVERAEKSSGRWW